MIDINIECPKCYETFVISPELMGKRVECSECSLQFVLSDEHAIDLKKRHYPGDNSKELNNFTKCIPTLVQDCPVDLRTEAFQQQVDPIILMPMDPKKLSAAIVAIIGALGLVAIFVLGDFKGGMLEHVTNDRRWILAVSVMMITCPLVVYGFQKYKRTGRTVAAVLAVALFSMPVFFSAEKKSFTGVYGASETKGLDDESLESEEVRMFKKEIGYASIEHKLEGAAHPERLVAIALKRAKPVHLDTIKDYIAQSLGSAEYPREYKGRRVNGVPATLLVYSNIQMPIASVAKVMDRFGAVSKIRSDLRVIEVDVNTSLLQVVDPEKLLNENNPSFHETNLGELRSIDQSRQLSAMQRLAKSKNFSHRADIVHALLDLLETNNYPYRSEVVDTLSTWVETNKDVEEVVTNQAREMMNANEEIPDTYLRYCVSKQIAGIGDILIYAWKRDPIVHENTLVNAGARAEKALLRELSSLDAALLESAMSVLRKVGGDTSLRSLVPLYQVARGDARKSLKATIDEIRSRR